MIRQPVVAGRFYPGNPEELRRSIHAFQQDSAPKAAAFGAVIPHAGYMYSGHVAGAVYSRLQLPGRIIVLCPNHTGLGPPLSIMASGAWDTPFGRAQIDEELTTLLMVADRKLTDDDAAHRYEHAVEVQLPFIQESAGLAVRFVPIVVGTADWNELENLGNALAEVIRRATNVMIIASSDMNHYESDQLTRVKDRKAIDAMLDLDATRLYEVVMRESISMCGFGPATAMLVAATQLGGVSKAELVKYATSGDVSGDYDRVVGYAGIIVT